MRSSPSRSSVSESSTVSGGSTRTTLSTWASRRSTSVSKWRWIWVFISSM